MICRILTLTEDAGGNPLLSNFADAHHVSRQDGTMVIVYAYAEKNRHRHSLILWRQSPGVYAVFGTDANVKKLVANGKNLTAYANQTTNAWRTYECDGTDSAIDPMTGKAVGSVSGRVVTFADQPPKEITSGKPYVVGTFTIKKATPVVASTCGPVDMVAAAKSTGDLPDDPLEIKTISKLEKSDATFTETTPAIKIKSISRSKKKSIVTKAKK